MARQDLVWEEEVDAPAAEHRDLVFEDEPEPEEQARATEFNGVQYHKAYSHTGGDGVHGHTEMIANTPDGRIVRTEGPVELGNTTGQAAPKVDVKPDGTPVVQKAHKDWTKPEGFKDYVGSMLLKTGRGAALGLQDPLAGLAGMRHENVHGARMIMSDGHEVPFETEGEQYRAERDRSKEMAKGASKQTGVVGTGLELAGNALGTAALAPVSKVLGRVIDKAAGAPTLFSAEAQRAAADMILPAFLQAGGEAESDLTKGEIPGWLAETGAGTFLGAGAAGAVHALGDAAKWAGGKLGEKFGWTNWLKDRAEKAAAENQTLANTNASQSHGINSTHLEKFPDPEVAEQRIGKTLLTRGMVKKDVPLRQLVKSAAAEEDAVGKQIGALTERIDQRTGGSGEEVRGRIALNKKLAKNEILNNANDFAKETSRTKSGVTKAVLTAAGESDKFAANAEKAARETAEQKVRNLNYKPRPDEYQAVYDKFYNEALVKNMQNPPKKAAARWAMLGEGAHTAPKEELVSAATDKALRTVKPNGSLPNEAAAVSALRPGQRAARAEKMADELAPAKGSGIGFDMHAFAKDLRAQLGKFTLPESISKQLDAKVAEYTRKAEQGVSVSEAAEIKTELQKLIAKWKDTPKSQELTKGVQRVLDDHVEAAVKRAGGEADHAAYTGLKSEYGDVAVAKQAVTGAAKHHEKALADVRIRENLKPNRARNAAIAAGVGGGGEALIEYLMQRFGSDQNESRTPNIEKVAGRALGAAALSGGTAAALSRGKMPIHGLNEFAKDALNYAEKAATGSWKELTKHPEAIKQAFDTGVNKVTHSGLPTKATLELYERLKKKYEGR